MRIIAYLAAVCIGCSLSATSHAAPTQHSGSSARANLTKQANRDHYRYKRHYHNGHRVDDPTEAGAAPGPGTAAILPENDAACCDRATIPLPKNLRTPVPTLEL